MKGKCDILQTLLLLLDSYHWFFLLLIIGFSCFHFLQHKNMEQHSRVIIFHTGCDCWTARQFKGQADFCDQDWFMVVIIPVLLWLIFLWYVIHSVFEWWLVLEMWCLHKLDRRPPIKNFLCFVIHIKLLTNGTGKTLGRGNPEKTE